MTSVGCILGTMTFGESVFSPAVSEFVDTFLESGYDELDTAFVYNNGECERLLGAALKHEKRPFRIATKVNPRITGRLDAEAAYFQVPESLERLELKSVDTVYLHFPDPATPVDSVLSAMADLHEQGKFKELGLSNFPSWMVVDVWHICKSHGWVLPTVYEGMYNPLARGAEEELIACLRHFGIRFYAYNPLAGGLLTGRYESYEDAPSDGRFTHRPNYQKRYWKPSYFKAIALLTKACESYRIGTVEATYRWLAHHSMLDGGCGDAVIVGASKISHLRQNIEAFNRGFLPDNVVSAFDDAWSLCSPDSPSYFTLYQGAGSVGGPGQ